MYEFEYSEKKWLQLLIEIKNKNLTSETKLKVARSCFGHSLRSEMCIFQQYTELKKQIPLDKKKENELNLVLYLTRLQQFLLFTNNLHSDIDNACKQLIINILNKKDLAIDDFNLVWEKTNDLSKNYP